MPIDGLKAAALSPQSLYGAAGRGRLTPQDVISTYDLPDSYIFYPAYFAAHKNHVSILEGLIDLERRYDIVLHAVFCGDPEDQVKVEQQVSGFGLTRRVHFLGLLPDNHIPPFYLIMLAYSGPTNLPPLEAIVLGCPVIYSDLPDFREPMGDAALYCDLTDPSSLADHLAALVKDAGLRDRLQAAGR